eukprot:2752728-Pyramimonas_sp.AAC.1
MELGRRPESMGATERNNHGATAGLPAIVLPAREAPPRPRGAAAGCAGPPRHAARPRGTRQPRGHFVRRGRNTQTQ